MSAVPVSPNKAPDQVTVEIDGKPVAIKKGAMIIEAADKLGVAIPRFCYHDKLPIAANCRMCLVDVEKAPKPMPACATPVMDGMKVYTQSKRALDSQRNVMEFLLINHPLDCPICDQGGECELQDVALGYGRSVSRFVEKKRVVADEDLGSLVATDMTRCIHCTRCVRFVGEIAGTYELGGMNRGEHTEIGTYIGKSLESELSGNIIDVCPVGALTNKVFRFRARAWELVARDSIGYHDALGSNLHLHTRRGEVLRSVPRDNEAINECWLSDRDRYSHQGLNAADRALQPMVRGADGELAAVSWEQALSFVVDRLKARRGNELGILVHPATSSEEGYCLARLAQGLGSPNLDHRLRVQDFVDQPVAAAFEMPLAEIENAGAILLVGSNPRLDQPLLGHRIRKASKRGAAVFTVNPVAFDFNFDTRREFIASPWKMAEELAALVAAAAPDNGGIPAELAELVSSAAVSDSHRAAVASLRDAATKVIIVGDFAVQHPAASVLRALSRQLAQLVGAACNELPIGPNAIGLVRNGVLPGEGGLDASAMLAQPRKAYVVYGVESLDCAEPSLYERALKQAETVIAFAPYASDEIKAVAHALLPIGLLPEIQASLTGVNGTEQSVLAGAKLPGESRAGWRVLRALGAALQLQGFDFVEFDELRSSMASGPAVAAAVATTVSKRSGGGEGLVRIATVPIYRVDGVVRRSSALQATPLAAPAAVALHPGAALARGLDAGALARVSDGSQEIELPVAIDSGVPQDAAWIASGHPETARLRGTGAALTVTRA